MFQKAKELVKRVMGNEVGGDYTENALWLALVVVVGVGAVTTLGVVIVNKIQSVANNINN